ncbi:hypothetical protein CROQUDRAFT_98129 [Cronartium quercuum f. sp. fusiforme G11]|uniref:Uncharacterized protein n=1 Tax=Cronartium quercuum f. sp. fusiforme G11 TaxID=708437 RepID=A0A9P6T7E3_9BASI|nr:hypothetical protein CROQUDRAFT_98129 [Cronartium quercuum f. sp. fusiforme G11]
MTSIITSPALLHEARRLIAYTDSSLIPELGVGAAVVVPGSDTLAQDGGRGGHMAGHCGLHPLQFLCQQPAGPEGPNPATEDHSGALPAEKHPARHPSPA